MTSYHLTFDIDWAPDWSVRDVLAELAEFDAPATFMMTHESPVIDEIRAAGHTIGIHPNFLAGSTQGDSAEEIVAALLAFCPEAAVMRTHALHQSSSLFHRLVGEFPQIKYDLSILMYRFPHLGWFDWRMSGQHFRRINYNWEDDVAFYDDDFVWDAYIPFAETTIFDFHPIHVSLNSCDEQPYLDLKQQLAGRPLSEAEREIVEAHQAPVGTRDYLHAVLASGVRALTFEELTCELD